MSAAIITVSFFNSQQAEDLTTPVLLLIFRRSDTTWRVFEAFRQARPTRLYVAANGPRPDHPTDTERCVKARAVVQEIDWPCDVFTLFQGKTLNCGL